MTSVHVQEHNLYRARCPNGHPLVTVLDHLPFELLFESGLEAYGDGYFRESVSSFAAALERLFEFSIRVELRAGSVESSQIDEMWKSVAKQSERQLGMYVGIRTLKEGALPQILTAKQASFRNDVIHRGIFPSGEQAFDFGEAVFQLVVNEVRRLSGVHNAEVNAEKQARYTNALRALEPGEVPTGTLGFGFAVASLGERSFKDVVLEKMSSLKRRRLGLPPGSELPG
ncbi:MAG: hypothetical protein ACT6R7_08000 [Brevundimonas aurantiaca]|uniref:hypothetical protein n=1 Tax=Brevundimonas aurantiaca TaxID=74316 RepID=UPI0040349123